MPILTLLTDFGLDDYYVAAVKGTLLRLAPGAVTQLVDISHEVAPGDVEGAAWLLAAACPAFPPGTVHQAVVDPGVGSGRRILAAAARGAFFVAPDNGLLTPLLGDPEVPPSEVRSVERSDLFLEAPGNTFHGRDRFAPVAAWLLRGGALSELGPPAGDPVLLPIPPPRRQGQTLIGRVAHIDRFGNLITDIPTAWLPEAPFTAAVGDRITRRRVDHYGQLAPGEVGLLPGSLGTLELSLDGRSLADHWGVSRGEKVVIQLPPGHARAGSRNRVVTRTELE